MNDFSDQTMTLAAMAPYADAPVHISHIGHIRLQESDRIHAIVTELRRAGIRCEEEEDALTIYPGVPHAPVIKTYEDHRMAMAFSSLGLRTDGIIIDDPLCRKKNIRKLFRTVYNIDSRVIIYNEKKRILVPLRVTRSGRVFSLILNN